jgi:acyl-CoA synthetase (AMP-forming)/AMP-acid ligase II
MNLSFPSGSTDTVTVGIRALIEERQAEPNRVGFVEGTTGRSLTWGGVAERARAWRAVSHELGGWRVGLMLADPVEMAAAVLGATSTGVAAVPLNPAATPDETGRQIAGLGLAAVVTDEVDGQLMAAVAGAGADVWRADPRRLWLVARGQGGPHRLPGDGAALVLASSGTTGEPKIIPLTAAQLLFTARAVVARHELTADDCGYSPLPLFHINGLVVGVLSTLVAGARLVLDRRFSARSFWKVAAEQEVTWFNLVPAIISVLAGLSPPPPEVARRIGFARSASAPLPAAVRERFEALTGIGVLEAYGMTEAASQIAANPRRQADRRPGSVGQPVGVELRVVHPSGHPVAPGTIGQVQIRGASVTPAYWAPAGTLPAVRPATDPEGWLSTGDLGRVDVAGFLYLVGRSDDVINRGGEKVYPREIEEVLLRDPCVEAAAVVGRAHTTVGEEPVAYVMAAADCHDPENLVARLERRCARELSRFRRPASIHLTAFLPTGPTGKVRPGELRRDFAAQASSP